VEQAADAGAAENPTEAVREQPIAQSPSKVFAQAVAESPSEAAGAQAVTESPPEAVGERGVTTEQVAASDAGSAEEVRPIDARIASGARERRLDQAGRPTVAYGLVFFLLLLSAALYGWRHARRSQTNRGQERSVLFRARRDPPPAFGQVRDQPESGTAAPPAKSRRGRRPALTGA
jgi:cobalamin biosynthesis Mg chelatase CobN